MAANASTPALPGTKYGETNRNARSGAPMLSGRRCQSKAPADDGSLIVGGERLVVHAPVEALEVREIAQEAPPSDLERVEQPNLDVRVRVERGEHGIETGGVVVVEQQPHSYAPLRGATQGGATQRARPIP